VPVLAVRRLRDLSPADRRRLLARATAQVFDPDLTASVRELVEDVRARGDAALCDALRRHDGVECDPSQLRVDEEEIELAARDLSADVLDAIRVGIVNIRAFNERLLEGSSWQAELSPGLLVGEQARPIASAALFVPSGKGSFPSVLMHIATPALVAGVAELTVLVPPKSGEGRSVDAAVLAVARELGLSRVVRVNGPTGIAAAAFGTETVPQAAKVVGPGSPAVTAAQVLVQAYGCAAAMLFGPSESLVIADESADPALLAADLLNEAEHGDDSAALLVTASERVVAAVDAELREQLAALPEPRRSYAAATLSGFGGAMLVDSLAEACAFASEYAPEHLQIATASPEALLPGLDHAGEILLGQTPFAAANYLLGVPNTLPTGRYARLASGVTARTFLKESSVARASDAALAQLAPGIVALAEHEGFPAHAAAIRRRGLA
jgi:histidinol dehydrogenase